MDSYAEDIVQGKRELSVNNQTSYTVFELDFSLPKGICFVDTLSIEWDVSKLHIIGHYSYETELINMQSNTFGTAQVAFGKTSEVDEKALVTIVEHENNNKPNTTAIMFPPNNKGMTGILNLREVKK